MLMPGNIQYEKVTSEIQSSDSISFVITFSDSLCPRNYGFANVKILDASTKNVIYEVTRFDFIQRKEVEGRRFRYNEFIVKFNLPNYVYQEEILFKPYTVCNLPAGGNAIKPVSLGELNIKLHDIFIKSEPTSSLYFLIPRGNWVINGKDYYENIMKKYIYKIKRNRGETLLHGTTNDTIRISEGTNYKIGCYGKGVFEYDDIYLSEGVIKSTYPFKF